ncbi:MGMT family protein [Corynebacterium hesseae]
MPPKNPSSSRVAEVVLRIPPGNVSTYGEIAKVVGVGARYVGWVMSKSEDLPWWRVVNSTGRAHTSAAQAHWDADGRACRRRGHPRRRHLPAHGFGGG